MGRRCFYCNRELHSGERCNCLASARAAARRAHTHGARASAAALSQRSEPRFIALSDFVRPLDALDQEPDQGFMAFAWMTIDVILTGLWYGRLLASSAAVWRGAAATMLAYVALFALLALQSRAHLRARLWMRSFFVRSRPIFVYTAAFTVLAFCLSYPWPHVSRLMQAATVVLLPSGLLWQARQNSPFDGNRYVWVVASTILLYGLVTVVLVHLAFFGFGCL